MNWSWSLSLYDGPLMFNTELWWRSLSNKALVRTGSPNTSGHFENVRFVVKIVLDFSYLFAMRLKNRLAVSASIFSYPNSSTIRSLYLQIHLILCSSLFSYLAFLSCAMRSWNEIQYTEYLCLAASVFMVELMHHKRRTSVRLLRVPGMALIQSEIVRPQVVTAKCSEPQADTIKVGVKEVV